MSAYCQAGALRWRASRASSPTTGALRAQTCLVACPSALSLTQTGRHVSPSPTIAPTRSEASFIRQEAMSSRFSPSGSHVKPVFPVKKPCQAVFPRQEAMSSRFSPSGSHVKPVFPVRKPCQANVPRRKPCANVVLHILACGSSCCRRKMPHVHVF